jgi:DNA-binding MarR family transcriptional regulator
MAKPTEAQLEALRSLLRARTTLTDRLETALRGEDLPPLGWFDVLCALDEAGEEGLRPRDLGYAVALTPSGLTRMLDRMTAAGLVERKACPTDRRGYGVTLTAAGRKTHAMMQPVYLREVQIAFASLLTDEEARALREVLDRVSHSACAAVGEEPPAEPVRAVA